MSAGLRTPPPEATTACTGSGTNRSKASAIERAVRAVAVATTSSGVHPPRASMQSSQRAFA